ncbi:hypothetical protein Ddc_09275 [Ditylenchus destructor]|nr:hypothetical protein Ddc_09275 [Ditylenchus destructor]
MEMSSLLRRCSTLHTSSSTLSSMKRKWPVSRFYSTYSFNLLFLTIISSTWLRETAAVPLLTAGIIDPVPVPIPEDVANTIEQSAPNPNDQRLMAKDDSNLKLDLSDFTDDELIRLARVLQRELETSPARNPPKAERRPRFPVNTAGVPVWVLPAETLEYNRESYPRDRRTSDDNEPIIILQDDDVVERITPSETIVDGEEDPVEFVIIDETPNAQGEIMAAPLSPAQRDEVELRQRMDELGDFLKERARRPSQAFAGVPIAEIVEID